MENKTVVDSKKGEIICERCGEKSSLKGKLPLSVPEMIIVLESFDKLHSFCKED